MFKHLLFILLLGVVLKSTNSARILAVVPTASYSHQMFFQQFWRELAIRGHDIVVITTDPTEEKLKNFKEVSIKESYPPMRGLIKTMVNGNLWTVISINDLMFDVVDFQMQLPQIQEILNNTTEQFDLLIVEHLMPVMLGFKHRFKCPMIGVTSLDAFPASHEAMGNPVHAVLYPISMLPFQENMTFFQRLVSYLYTNVLNVLRHLYAERANSIIRKYFGNDAPDIYQLVDDTDMLFVNANPLITPVRPHTPSTINIAGGMHMKPPKKLPKDLKKFLDSGTDGVIYFSMGSNVKSAELSNETRSVIMQTFSDLPYKVLWKFEDDQLIGKPNNVKIIKWAPQQDVLRHKNVKLFITQAGLQSLEESLYSHKPMVTIPYFADQIANAAKVKAKDMGVMLDKDKLNVNDFKAAILEVMENPKYLNNVVELATAIQDEPMTPLNKAVWWTEYVLRHKGASHLKGPRAPLYQYYYLDVFAFLSVVFVLAISILAGIAFFIYVKTVSACCKAPRSASNKIKTG